MYEPKLENLFINTTSYLPFKGKVFLAFNIRSYYPKYPRLTLLSEGKQWVEPGISSIVIQKFGLEHIAPRDMFLTVNTSVACKVLQICLNNARMIFLW